MVAAGLAEAGIESRTYFPPAHRQPVFPAQDVDLPVTDWVHERMLSLPVHVGLPEADLDEVAKRVSDLVG